MAEKNKNNINTLPLKRLYNIVNGLTATALSPEQQSREDLHVLSSDPAFLSILVNNIIPEIVTTGGINNGIVGSDDSLINQLSSAILGGDTADISDAITDIFGDDSLKWERTPTTDAIDPDIRYVSTSLLSGTVDIPAIAMLNLTPAARAVLGFEGVSFENPQTGLIDVPARGVFSMTKAELDAFLEKPTVTTYTGVDITTSVAIGKIITNIQDLKTVSYSTHRANTQVRSCGSAYPRGISRGPRTIGGSLICTVRLIDPMKSLDPQVLMGYDDFTIESDTDLFKETMLPDQYPLFDLLLFYQNEVGDASALIIYGISIHDVGQTSSISDTETEVQYVYTAMDIDPIRMIRFNKDGTVINPFESNAYLRRKQRIVQGTTLHNDPYDIPSVRGSHGNMSHLEFIL